MKKDLKNKPNWQLRKELRQKGFHVYIFLYGAKRACRILARKSMDVYWVFAEPYGFMVLNHDDIEKINTARMANDMKKLRVRDMKRMSIYRYPKNAWGY